MIHTRQNGHRSVIHVARAVDVFVADLKLGVFQPDRGSRLVHIQSTLENVSGSLELSLHMGEEKRHYLLLFPLCILYVVSNVLLLVANALLESSTLQEPKLGQFLHALVRDAQHELRSSGFSGLPFCALPRVARSHLAAVALQGVGREQDLGS